MQISIFEVCLQEIRKSQKSVFQIAKESGVHWNTIGSWLRGDSMPSIFNLELVLNTIGYTLILRRLENTDVGDEGDGDGDPMRSRLER